MTYYYSNPPPPLPPGWVAATDPLSGNIYYANPTTGETSWQPPPPLAPPPVVFESTSNSIPHNPEPSLTSNHPSLPNNHNNEFSIQTKLSRRLLLVPAARAIVSKYNNTNDATSETSGPTPSPSIPIELRMKAGMISDLVQVQRQYRIEQAETNTSKETTTTTTTTMEHDVSIQPYEPLKPFELPMGKCIDPVAEARVDVRFMMLMDELSKI